MRGKKMKRIAKFHKVSYEQFEKDWMDEFPHYPIEKVREIYDAIKLPKRATSGSAGYDFFMPMDYNIAINSYVKIPTGIRCEMEDGWVLKEYPRSGHGFKYGIHMSNTVGIIDSDYFYSDNEGHIMIKLVNDSELAKLISLKQGDAFCQGIFVEYGITVDDEVTGIRNGGFGSTSERRE